MIRAAWVLVAGALMTFVYAIRAIVVSYRPGERGRCACERVARIWSKRVLRLAGARVRVTGLENLPRGEPRIAVCNHQSWFDVFTLAAELPVELRFVAKQELGRIPVFGRAWRRCGHISIDRGDRASAIESLERASRQIREESLTIVMFPEGTRSPTGKLQRFKKGAFVLAIQTGVPVVPLAIRGTRNVMPKGSWRISPGEIEVRVGTPIPVDGLQHRDRDALATRARDAVERLLEGTDPLLEGTAPAPQAGSVDGEDRGEEGEGVEAASEGGGTERSAERSDAT